MRIIVTHTSPDWDGITSIWLLKRFLPGWENASIQFVPAGERLEGSRRLPRVANDVRRASSDHSISSPSSLSERRLPKTDNSSDEKSGSAFSSFASGQSLLAEDVIELIDSNEVIHVDTGLGHLDHHQTDNQKESAASRTWSYVKKISNIKYQISNTEKIKDRTEAIDRIVKVVVDIDHFKEVFLENPTADYHEFSLIGLLDGLKLQKPDQDNYYVGFGLQCLDAVLHSFENRIWAEKEIKESGKEFETRFGKGIGFETINDTVIKLAQKMGYVIVVRKDPRKGYVRIKARPAQKWKVESGKLKKKSQRKDIDLTLAYEQLRKIDPEATWFLHVSKKMLLNGTVKNPKMKATRLTLDQIIKVLETI